MDLLQEPSWSYPWRRVGRAPLLRLLGPSINNGPTRGFRLVRDPSTVVPAQGLVQIAGLWPAWLGLAGAGAGERAGWR